MFNNLPKKQKNVKRVGGNLGIKKKSITQRRKGTEILRGKGKN
jgi:hypothetical protein